MINQPQVVTSGVKKPIGQGSYQSLYDADPYAGAQYSESPWQSLLSSVFGIRTGADAWRENMAVQSAEYQAQMAMKQYDEEYNLPINQVARMRAAGLNPDLNGGQSISPGEAANPGQDPSVPMQSQGSEGIAMSVANGLMSCFSSALGMVQALQGIHGTKLQNTLLAIEGEQKFQQFTEGIAPIFLPESPNPDGIQNFDWKGVALKSASAFAGEHIPKSMQKKFLDSISQYWSSAIGEGESYSDFRNRISEKRGYATESQTFWSEIDDVLMMITEPLAEMSEKIFSQGQKTEFEEGKSAEKQAIYTEGLYDEKSGLDPETAAAAENATNKNAYESQSSLSIVNGTLNEVMKNLKVGSQKKGLEGALCSIALALISGFYVYTQSNIHPHISSSSGQGSFSGRNGSGSHSSRSFSLGF